MKANSMNNKPINLLTILPAYFIIILSACVKQSDLDKVPDGNLALFKSVEDAQALLDNMIVMQETPALGEISADNFYIPDTVEYDKVELNAYLWKDDIFEGRKLSGDWYQPYRQVFYANTILDALPHLSGGKAQQVTHVKGAALFIRAYAFHNVALEFANLYDPATAASDMGIPLPLLPEPFAVPVRASVSETYKKIIRDASDAARYLPQAPDPLRKNRPSIPAAFALMARVYLSMGDYQNAKLYADSCLMQYGTLIDYNSIDTTFAHPFTANNAEVLYQSNLLSTVSMFDHGNCYIDSLLYRSFATDDLRKCLFFSLDNSGLPIPRHSYTGNITRFSGLAVDEVILIRAECNARLYKFADALQDLTSLMKRRWKNGSYTLPPLNTAEQILELILSERRKELLFRGTRLADIRRLNKQGASITLQRWFHQKSYTLAPGDPKYVLPIPPDVIAINSAVVQNPR